MVKEDLDIVFHPFHKVLACLLNYICALVSLILKFCTRSQITESVLVVTVVLNLISRIVPDCMHDQLQAFLYKPIQL